MSKVTKQKEFAALKVGSRVKEIVKARGLKQKEFLKDLNNVADKEIIFRTLQSLMLN